MAYVSQELKKRIAAKLKPVVPKNWKYSLSVHHHSTLVMTISQGPAALAVIPEHWNHIDGVTVPAASVDHRQLNVYHMDKEYPEGSEVGKTMAQVMTVLNDGNHDRSDIQTDYFDVGWYVHVNVGRWNKPFVAVS